MVNFIFMYPYWLLGLIFIPIFLLLYYKTNKISHKLIAPHLAQVMQQNSVSVKKWYKKAPLYWAFAWALACLALASPSLQTNTKPDFSTQKNRILILDMSLSMYATDLSPNRLMQLRYKALDLLKQWQEGSTGLIVYAGNAYTLSPLTSDTNTLFGIINNIKPELMPYDGDNLLAAIELAKEQFMQSSIYQGDIVVFTGSANALQTETIIDELLATNFNISVLAIGTKMGAPVSLTDGSLLKDKDGEIIITQPNFQLLQELANKTGGIFMPFSLDSQDIEILANFTNKLDKIKKDHNLSNTSTKAETYHNYGYFLIPLILIPALLLFSRGFIWMIALTFVVTGFTPEAMANLWSPFLNNDQQGELLYKQGEYAKAKQIFKDRNWQGVSAYEAGDYKSAIDAFELDTSFNGRYNLANALAQNGDLDNAAKIYRQLLKEQDDFAPAKNNLTIIEDMQRKQEQQQSDNNEQNQKQEQQQSENNEQNQKQEQQQSDNNEQNQKQEPQQSDNNEQDQASQNDGDQKQNNSTFQEQDPQPKNDQTSKQGQKQESQSKIIKQTMSKKQSKNLMKI